MLGDASRLGCRRVVVSRGASMVSSEFQQMRANGIQAVVFRDSWVVVQRVQQFKPFAGPCTMAAAMA